MRQTLKAIIPLVAAHSDTTPNSTCLKYRKYINVLFVGTVILVRPSLHFVKYRY